MYIETHNIYFVKLCSNQIKGKVEGDPKAIFSISTTPRCRGGHYSFSWIAPLYLDLYLIMLSVKQGSIKYHFLSLWYDSTWDWTPVPRALANTLIWIKTVIFGELHFEFKKKQLSVIYLISIKFQYLWTRYFIGNIMEIFTRKIFEFTLLKSERIGGKLTVIKHPTTNVSTLP